MERTRVDLTIIQTPVKVFYNCPHCEEDIELPFQSFVNLHGEPCDWTYSDMNCEHCKKT